MELVQLGDATAEEKLTMLAHGHTAAVLEPEVGRRGAGLASAASSRAGSQDRAVTSIEAGAGMFSFARRWQQAGRILFWRCLLSGCLPV